jgi:ribosome biogenesis GTPase / thiamine phosphate phosphatase
MSREERKLRKHLEAHARRELRKALSKGRVKDWKPPRERVNIDDDEEDYLPPARSYRTATESYRTATDSYRAATDSYRAATVRESVVESRKTRKEPDAPVSRGFVAEAGPGFCDVQSAGERIRCRYAGDVVVGDQVLFSPDRRRIENVLPRRTTLSRADPHNPRLERVIAANVDVVVNVVSLKRPPLRPGLIDRYLIAIGKSGAEPLICVNKIDLLAGPDELDPLRPYQDIGIQVIFCSAVTGVGLESLSEALAGRSCVFAGHSGVGKSSLLNALDPQLEITTGSVSGANEKGRHTTTSSTLYHLPSGAIVIDTPGIREFGLWDVTPDDLRRYYKEFDAYQCAFSDCTHTHEPDCSVKQALASGAISIARYESYARILASLGGTTT